MAKYKLVVEFEDETREYYARSWGYVANERLKFSTSLHGKTVYIMDRNIKLFTVEQID